MCSISRNWLTYCKSHWVDLVIILLPLIEYLRILRMSRLARLQRLAKTTGQAYRLRSVAMKAWRALLLLEALQRLTAGTPEKRLAKLRRELDDCHALAARLEVEIRETEAKIAQARVESGSTSEVTVPSAVCDVPPR
jgi:voltage-gated potassium channel